jgi:TM2 domain-containing membrane protein YozV
MTHTSTIDPSTAAFLSFLIPGWGQMRRGKIKVGLIWMLVVLVGYFLMIVPGLILHLINMLDAYWRE